MQDCPAGDAEAARHGNGMRSILSEEEAKEGRKEEEAVLARAEPPLQGLSRGEERRDEFLCP